MTSRADEKELSSLHAELAKVLKTALSKEYKDEQGNTLPPPAAILNVARQFLKDNHIESGNAPKGSAIGDLSDLPVFDGDGEHHTAH